jgi:hypothetical protein
MALRTADLEAVAASTPTGPDVWWTVLRYASVHATPSVTEYRVLLDAVKALDAPCWLWELFQYNRSIERGRTRIDRTEMAWDRGQL